MYGQFENFLKNTLDEITANNLYKKERVISSPQKPRLTLADGRELLNMCANNYLGLADHPEITEVIVATNQTAEGNATALYLSRMLGPSGIKVSRLASGLPMGSDIEYADEGTLLNAYEGRRKV